MTSSSLKIVVIGAGSASFGLNTLAALMASKKLHGTHLALVDQNPQSLLLVGQLANKLNQEWQAHMHITTHQHHWEALAGAGFVVLAIEVSPREALWRQDFEIPLKYGVRQPYAENGGPGGFAHAARNIGPVMQIVRDMENICPEAWLINYTNPMMRICDAVHRHSNIKVVGLCHQIFTGYAMAAKTLADDLGFTIPSGFTNCHSSPVTNPIRKKVIKQAVPRLQIKAAGLNHFTFMLAIHDKKTGEDLYPLFRERWSALPEKFEPLTRQVFDAFGLFPIPGDEHLAEYLPWLSDPVTKPWDKYDVSLYDWDYWAGHREDGYQKIRRMIAGDESVESLRASDSEGALEIIEHIHLGGTHYHAAFNLPNTGQIPNLPLGAIVETSGVVDSTGIHPVAVGRLPDGIAEILRREITCVQLGVDAAVSGDRQLALQCLLLDPVITDMDTAKLVLDDYLASYREYLPQFWNN